jgi:hypothetical protein
VWKLDEFWEGTDRLIALGRQAAGKVNEVYLDMLAMRKPGDARGLEIAYLGEGEFQPRVERVLIDHDAGTVSFNVYNDFGVAYCEPAEAEPIIAEKQ